MTIDCDVTSYKRWSGEQQMLGCAVHFYEHLCHTHRIESMDTLSSMNAIRRFFANRGTAKQLRSDCGTNFVGECSELGIKFNSVDTVKVGTYLSDHNCKWLFNPPLSSIMGGVWERMIGVTRRISESMLLEHRPGHLSHAFLGTLLAEVSAIFNTRLLVPVSVDLKYSDILTPAILLTQKNDSNSSAPGTFDIKDLHEHQWHQVQ